MPDIDLLLAALLWNRGYDTGQIANLLGMSEAQIYRYINRIKELARRIREVLIPKGASE